MFGHPGISALEYAGSLQAARKRSTSEIMEPPQRMSTILTRDDNTTPPTTADSEPTGSGLSPVVHYIDEFGCQQRRRGAFLNHTPRHFEMRSPVEVYRPSTAFNENYSRPITSYQATPGDNSHAYAGQHIYHMSTDLASTEKRMTINPEAPAELDLNEVASTMRLEVYRPSANPHRRSTSMPLTRIVTHQPRSIFLSDQQGQEDSVRSTTNSVAYPQEKKRQRRQTPFKIGSPKSTNAPRHASMEPWVAEHRRRGTNDTVDFLPPLPTEKDEEFGTFGVIQRYFDSQTGGPVSSPKALCKSCSPCSSDVLPPPAQPTHQSLLIEPAAGFAIDEFDLHNEIPPAVPDRSPKRLTNSCFPIHVESTVSIDSEFVFAAKGQYSPYDEESGALHVPKKRMEKRLNVGQADRAGLSNVGKLAPPILSHDALTATSHLELNDFNFYLRNTGPSPEPQLTSRPRKTKGMRMFKVKQRKTLAARVGSVEGSPQRARKQTVVPACAREMMTLGGARHLKIVIPTETSPGGHTVALPVVAQLKKKHQPKRISILGDFTEEMLNPLASPEIEDMLSGFRTPPRKLFSEPISKSPRSAKRAPKSPKPIPVDNHPLATREEQTRARKLRDLQRIKRKSLPVYTQSDKHVDAIAGAPLTPAQTPEPKCGSSVCSAHTDKSYMETDKADNNMVKIQERVVSLQRQNTELTEALAKIVGLELEEGDLKSEDVLDAFRRIRFFRTPGTE